MLGRVGCCREACAWACIAQCGLRQAPPFRPAHRANLRPARFRRERPGSAIASPSQERIESGRPVAKCHIQALNATFCPRTAPAAKYILLSANSSGSGDFIA